MDKLIVTKNVPRRNAMLLRASSLAIHTPIICKPIAFVRKFFFLLACTSDNHRLYLRWFDYELFTRSTCELRNSLDINTHGAQMKIMIASDKTEASFESYRALTVIFSTSNTLFDEPYGKLNVSSVDYYDDFIAINHTRCCWECDLKSIKLLNCKQFRA